MTEIKKNIIDPKYLSEKYLKKYSFSMDAQYKFKCFKDTILNLDKIYKLKINRFADIGCGSGELTNLIQQFLFTEYNTRDCVGYDFYEDLEKLDNHKVKFIKGDVCESKESYDLLSLFDVIEHVFCPTAFLANLSKKCDIIIIHFSLDNSLKNTLRNKYKNLLAELGHISFFDTSSALNLISEAGLKVVHYQYSPGFLCPSGHKSILQKILFPIRYLLFIINPYIVMH